MNRNHGDEFVAVRVQDPRIQNEGSWNSYVDYKIFLHTNSKAFTAKTSCVRRRYSEFVWLKKKLQKNAGLVPVPDLPGKSFFSFSNEDFLERRRKGLQVFLDKVVNMTVCLSDSQLHLFLQTQLPVGHIQDCVQGHTPYTVTDAILTYASSNWGLAQAQTQEDDDIKERSLTISYESMESPAPHQPCQQTRETLGPKSLQCGESDPLEGLLEPRHKDMAKIQHTQKSLIKISQKNNHLEAVIECDRSPAEATFYLGDSQDEQECHWLAEQNQQWRGQIQTPVEVHSLMGTTGFEQDCAVDNEEQCRETEHEESDKTLDAGEQSVCHSEMKLEADQLEGFTSKPDKCPNAVVVLDFKDNDSMEQVTERDTTCQEEVLKVICSRKQVLENHMISEVNHADGAVALVSDVCCAEESDGHKQPDRESPESGSKQEMLLQSEIHVEADNVNSVQDLKNGGAVPQMAKKQVEQEVDLVGTKDEGNDDSHSMSSSNESIVQVSDEESICDETEDLIQASNSYMETCPDDTSHWPEPVLDLQVNGCPVKKEDLQYLTSLDINSPVAGGRLSESGDFSILETSCMPGITDGKRTEEENVSSVSCDASEETHEVKVH